MGEVLSELGRSPALLERLRLRAPACWLCKWILLDLEKNGRFVGEPFDFLGKPEFPVSGRLRHLLLERGRIPPKGNVSDEDLASIVAHLCDSEI